MIVKYLLIAVIGYLLGSISTGILYSRFLGQDIRTQGSKNAGATNMARVHGISKGLITLVGDSLKGVLATLIGLWIAGQTGAMIGGAAAAIGHMWPVFFDFKGGKGVATLLGVGLVIHPVVLLIALALAILTIVLTKYVSLGSMVGVTSFTIGVIIAVGLWPVGLWAAALSALCFWRHKANIQRLLKGTENKFNLKKK
ncbi:MAG: glycerol-3-phosphate 1-O-acyltransferase PlsY [Clostridia bacterium]|nr:glycerol-3-phosphate 1-O-acyltransferase PlsY [Clostridia bacterium]